MISFRNEMSARRAATRVGSWLGLAAAAAMIFAATDAPAQSRISSRNEPDIRAARPYDYYLNLRRTGYTFIPYTVARPTRGQPMVLGPVRPYTDSEYARLLLATIGAPSPKPFGMVDTTETVKSRVINPDTGEMGLGQVTIADVSDRGIMLTDTREEIKLRGVRIASDRDFNEVNRLYGREAVDYLRKVTAAGPLYISMGEPERGTAGTLLVTLFLADGTSLNEEIIARGYGKVDPGDFLPEDDYSNLTLLERTALANRLGLWSSR